MGPNRAAVHFAEKTPDAASYRVTLCGSLASTGRGHLTDVAVINALKPKQTEILWRPDIIKEFHTNAMIFEAMDAEGGVMTSETIYSVGGGEISFGPGEPVKVSQQIYSHNTCEQVQHHIEKHGISFWEYVEYAEGPDIWDYLMTIWEQMQKSIMEGLENDRVLPGILQLKSKAKRYYVRASSLKPSLQSRALVMAYAMAVAEQNARGGIVVTAPTCGSCGVVPSVLYHMKTAHGFQDRDILKSLATAGLFGNMIKTNASIAGAEVGCQGEVGSACVMAAVAVNQLFGGTPQQIECAAEMAMEHNLGLTCDPVHGLVQIPCIERNTVAALRAMDVSLIALLSDGKHMVSFDKVVSTMKKTGKDLPSLYKETAMGGLATEYDNEKM